jgi:hypothetical protein
MRCLLTHALAALYLLLLLLLPAVVVQGLQQLHLLQQAAVLLHHPLLYYLDTQLARPLALLQEHRALPGLQPRPLPHHYQAQVSL